MQREMQPLCACEHPASVAPHSIYCCPSIGHMYSEIAPETPELTSQSAVAQCDAMSSNAHLHARAVSQLSSTPQLATRQVQSYLSESTRALAKLAAQHEHWHTEMVEKLRLWARTLNRDSATDQQQRDAIVKFIADSTKALDQRIAMQEIVQDACKKQMQLLLETIEQMASAQVELLNMALNQQRCSDQLMRTLECAVAPLAGTQTP